MTEMWSPQGEQVPFEKPVEAKGEFIPSPRVVQDCALVPYQSTSSADACAGAGMVEAWVQGVVDGMQGTMKAIIKRAARHVNELPLEEFLFSYPAQVALLGLQFQWTADTQVSCTCWQMISNLINGWRLKDWHANKSKSRQ